MKHFWEPNSCSNCEILDLYLIMKRCRLVLYCGQMFWENIVISSVWFIRVQFKTWVIYIQQTHLLLLLRMNRKGSLFMYHLIVTQWGFKVFDKIIIIDVYKIKSIKNVSKKNMACWTITMYQYLLMHRVHTWG